jgi:DNA-binding response OmpR family regulator
MSIPSFEDPNVTKVRPMEALAQAPILIVEDERDLAEEIRSELQAGGHPVTLSETVEDALKAARAGGASVLVVDRMLHGEDGLSIIETLRSEGNATPVLVISALSSVDERINGLKAGGDDYLVKPFDIRELTARVEALLRRRGDSRVRFGVDLGGAMHRGLQAPARLGELRQRRCPARHQPAHRLVHRRVRRRRDVRGDLAVELAGPGADAAQAPGHLLDRCGDDLDL